MREQEAAKLDTIHSKQLKQSRAAATANAEDQFKTRILPVMMEIKGILVASSSKSSSDSLSDESLEKLARWKLGL